MHYSVPVQEEVPVHPNFIEFLDQFGFQPGDIMLSQVCLALYMEGEPVFGDESSGDVETDSGVTFWVPFEAQREKSPERLMISEEQLLEVLGLDHGVPDGLQFIERFYNMKELVLGKVMGIYQSRRSIPLENIEFYELLFERLLSLAGKRELTYVSEGFIRTFASVLERQLIREGEFCPFTSYFLKEIYKIRKQYVSRRPCF